MDEKQIARFWKKVDKDGPTVTHVEGLEPCWIWLDKPTSDGYGAFGVAPRVYKAHRVAWFLRHGSWPPRCALHKCDNRLCVNPDHLFDGTRTDNNRDMFSKGRNRVPDMSGSRGPGAKLTQEETLRIIQLGVDGVTPMDITKAFPMVTISNVEAILDGRSWKSLPRPAALQNRKRHVVLTQELADEIRASNEKGVVLAKRYGVKEAAISAIRCGRSWVRRVPK